MKKGIHKQILFTFCVFFISAIFCYFINMNVRMRSLYMDDLQDYYYFLRQSLFEFAFGVVEGQLHYRPVVYSLLYIIYALISKHIWRILVINIFIQSVISTAIYILVRQLKINSVLALFCSYMYLLSHFSYFQMGQVIGVIESTALFLSIVILMLCIFYLLSNDKKMYGKYEILIFVLYLLLMLAHERYISQVILILLTFIIKRFITCDTDNKQMLKNVIVILIETIFVFVLRFILLGSIVPIGTSKSNVLETFKFSEAFSYAVSQVIYIFGINDGPEYLCGINFTDCNEQIKLFVYISVALLLFIIIYYIFIKIMKYIRELKEKEILTGNLFLKNFYVDILVITYIAMCIAASSVTIRLEMRWIYASFTAAMIYLSYMVQTVLSKKSIAKYLIVVCLLFFTIFRTNAEVYYRNFYHKIFFFHDLQITNSLADETIYKYGEEGMKNKKVYILNNNFSISGKSFYYFFEPFTGKKNETDDLVLNVIENFDPTKTEHMAIFMDTSSIVLAEDIANNRYIRLNPDS